MDPLLELQGDPSKRLRGVRPLPPTGARTLFGMKAFCAVILFVSAIAQAILIFVSSQFGLTVNSVTNFRDGALERANGYPAPVDAVLGTVNIGYIFAAASFFAAAGYLLNLFLNDPEWRQLAIGSNPYIWIEFMLAHVTIFLGVAFQVGMADWALLTAFVTLVFAHLALLWVGDLLNSYAYRGAMSEVGGSPWSWAYMIFVAVIFLIEVILAVVYAITTFSGAPAGFGLLAIVPVVAYLLYLYFFFVIVLHYMKVAFFAGMYERELFLYIGNGLYVFLVSWLALVLFRFR